MLIIAALMAYSEFFFFYSLGASVAKNIYCSVFSEKYKVPKKKSLQARVHTSTLPKTLWPCTVEVSISWWPNPSVDLCTHQYFLPWPSPWSMQAERERTSAWHRLWCPAHPAKARDLWLKLPTTQALVAVLTFGSNLKHGSGFYQ